MSARADEPLAHALALAVAKVTVNETRREGDLWLKRRRSGSRFVIASGNVYLQRAGHFTMLARPSRWAEREVAVARALYGEAHAGSGLRGGMWIVHVPGETLTALLAREGAVHTEVTALRAAGNELRRAHSVIVQGRPFSHGDLHLSNVLHCPLARRTHLIDFETEHCPELATAPRHADDLVCLALDLVGKTPGRAAAQWHELLAGYVGAGGEDVLQVVRLVAQRLIVEEHVLPRSLQLIRTRQMPRAALAVALASLRAVTLG